MKRNKRLQGEKKIKGSRGKNIKQTNSCAHCLSNLLSTKENISGHRHKVGAVSGMVRTQPASQAINIH